MCKHLAQRQHTGQTAVTCVSHLRGSFLGCCFFGGGQGEETRRGEGEGGRRATVTQSLCATANRHWWRLLFISSPLPRDSLKRFPAKLNSSLFFCFFLFFFYFFIFFIQARSWPTVDNYCSERFSRRSPKTSPGNCPSYVTRADRGTAVKSFD